MALSHERCSELLGPYSRGQLTENDAAEVEQHLRGCDACRSEHAGLAVLLGAPPSEMTTSERALLHGTLEKALASSPTPLVIKPADRGWRARLAPALGAAALMGAIVGGYYIVSGGGAQESSIGTDTGDTFERNSVDQVGDTSGNDTSGGGGAGGSGQETTVTEHSAAVATPEPTFSIERDPFSTNELTRLGESALPMVLFARAYTGLDASRRREVFLDQLAGSASDAVGARYASLVKECAHSILKTDTPTRPAFGVMGRLGEDRVMVLGFAWTEDSSGYLDKYDLWAWPRDSCESPVDHRMGAIHAGD